MRWVVGLGLMAGLGGFCGLLADTSRSGEKDAEIVQEERLLREAGIGCDGPGILAFFRSRTLSAADQERLKQAVRQLGDDTFAVREQASQDIIRAGRFSLPLLRPLVGDSDLERSSPSWRTA